MILKIAEIDGRKKEKKKKQVTAFLMVVTVTGFRSNRKKKKSELNEHNKPGRTSCFSDDVDRRSEANDNSCLFCFFLLLLRLLLSRR